MSSTVTTTTVTAVTVASSSSGVGEVAVTFTLLATLLLGIVLLGKEVCSAGRGEHLRRFARGLDIATGPLLVSFLTMLAIFTVDFSSH